VIAAEPLPRLDNEQPQIRAALFQPVSGQRRSQPAPGEYDVILRHI
jgi:hypothetical protein